MIAGCSERWISRGNKLFGPTLSATPVVTGPLKPHTLSRSSSSWSFTEMVSEDLSPYHAELAVASGKPTSGLPVTRPLKSLGGGPDRFASLRFPRNGVDSYVLPVLSS